MSTLSLFGANKSPVPGSTSWYLADLGEFRGKQELYTRQAPQRLRNLRELIIYQNDPGPTKLRIRLVVRLLATE